MPIRIGNAPLRLLDLAGRAGSAATAIERECQLPVGEIEYLVKRHHIRQH